MLKSIVFAIIALSSCTDAFVPSSLSLINSRTTQSSSTTSSNTILYISSWGTKGPPSRWSDNVLKDPEKKIQDYLEEPEAVEARTNVDGICLVSGLINAKDRTDQFIFDLLNHEDSAYEFTKIIAFVDDSKFSKKRLLSRSARYTGLLDKLDFIQSNTIGALPTIEQLNGVKTWLAVIGVTETGVQTNDEKLQQLIDIATIAKNVPSLENIAILMMNSNEMDPNSSSNALNILKDSGKTYTLVAVGTIEDRPEGQTFYHYGEFGTSDAVLPSTAVFSREESYRMITELLQLESGINKALTFADIYNVNVTEAKLIKGLREAGYARPQEIDHMIREGPTVSKL